MKTKTENIAAIITVKDAEHMSAGRRRDIANWMRRQARFLESRGKEFSKRFTARYFNP